MAESFQLRCHHCNRWIGESHAPMELVGVFRHSRDCELLPSPRSTWQCKSCGWVNVFRVVEFATATAGWRKVELKQTG